MKVFKFNVVQIDTYEKEFEIEAETAEEAEEKLRADLDDQGLETHSGSFSDSDLEITFNQD